MNKLIIVLLLFASLITYAIGEYLSKIWSMKPSWWLAVITAVVYSLGVFSWLPALKLHGQLSAITVAWSCAYVITGLLVGVFFFNEVITTQQMIGIILALIATVLTL